MQYFYKLSLSFIYLYPRPALSCGFSLSRGLGDHPVADSLTGDSCMRIQPVKATSNLLHQEGDAANETETTNLLHRGAKGIDVVGLLITRQVPERDCPTL